MKKGFAFMIILFLKIYEKKDLCIQLLEEFKKSNENQKDIDKNMDRKECLKDYISSFNSIKSEAEKIIEKNNYVPIKFYGILLCYLNYYDYENFTSIVNELYKKVNEKKDEKNILFEILFIYNAHFKYPINQNLEFFNKLIIYAIDNKDFPTFEKGLNYIKDIESFLYIIEKNSEAIFKKYNAQKLEKIIKLDDLKFKKTGDKSQVILTEEAVTKAKYIEIQEQNEEDSKKKKRYYGYY